MTGYKIIYGKEGHDCWGCADFDWLGCWNNTIYTNKQKCLDEIKSLKEEYRRQRYDFDIKEVNIDIECEYDEAF